MGVVSFLGVVGLSAAVAVGVGRYRPSVVGQLARQTGVGGRVGWAAFLATAVWAFLPLLAGAETDGAAWAVGAAVAGVGCYLLIVAAGAIEEYRLLAGVEGVDPGAAPPGSRWFSADGFWGSCCPGRRCRPDPRVVPPAGHRTSTPQSRNSPR